MVLLLLAFALVASVGTATRGIIAEEVAPYLRHHTMVLEGRPCAPPQLSPPYEPGAPAGPRFVATSSWPIVAYEGRTRSWPVLIRAYESAIASYVGIALGPLLGGGIAGIRRSTILLECLVIGLTALCAGRSGRKQALWATALLATSFGMIWIARTGYAFEVGSRAGMMASLALLSRRGPVDRLRASAAGVLAGVAIASRATIVTALVPALAVLLWQRDRRQAWTVLRVGGIAVLLPVAGLAVVVRLAPLRSGTEPLATLPWAGLLERIALMPRHALLDLGWLGDSTSIWAPVYEGQRSFGSTLWLPAAVASVAVVAAAVRLVWRRATEPEAMLLAAFAGSVVCAGILYRDGNQFQLAPPLEPLFALAVAEQLVALGDVRSGAVRTAWLVGAAVLALRVQGVARGMALDRRIANPMLSGTAQRAAVQRMRALGIQGPELVTTTYNHAGVVEAWTDEAVRPIHAWPLLMSNDGERLRSAWTAILATQHPKYVLLTLGSNVVESGGTNVTAIGSALDEVLASHGIASSRTVFETESGAPGWALVSIGGTVSPDEVPTASECAPRDRPLPDLSGVRVGDRVDDCTVHAIEWVTADGRGSLSPRMSRRRAEPLCQPAQDLLHRAGARRRMEHLLPQRRAGGDDSPACGLRRGGAGGPPRARDRSGDPVTRRHDSGARRVRDMRTSCRTPMSGWSPRFTERSGCTTRSTDRLCGRK
jgi:hypothetical protein